MSKLIVNTGSLMSGGAERVLSTLSKCFADNFDEVFFVLWLDQRYPGVFYNIDSRVKIIRISKASKSNNRFRQMIWYRRFVCREKPSRILSFMVMINFCVMLSLIGLSFPIIVSERNDPRYFHHGLFLRKIISFMYRLPNVKALILQTQSNKEFFPKRIQKKSFVISNPIQISEDLLGIALRTNKTNKIVTVARLEPQKQINVMIDAFNEFHSNHSNYKFFIYGEGSCRSALEEQIIKLALSDCVVLAGRTDNVFDSIKDANVFVMSSLYEGMSNSLIEAMCAGLPCVSTKVSGATDLITNNNNGCLVEINDVEGLVQAISRIVDNPSFAFRIAQNSVSVYNELKMSVVENKWIKVLKS